MLKHYPFDTLGGADHGWLNAKHHFSFAGYHDPKKMSFGELLVINDDRIAPYTGFDTHPHRDMEIITYVRRGAITHKDSRGNKGRTTAGNVQVMSAGTGIMHSEYNHEDEETNIFQIWIMPRSKGIEPRWDAAEFPREPVTDRLPLLVSGDGEAPLQDPSGCADFRRYADKGHKPETCRDRAGLSSGLRGRGHRQRHKGRKGDGIAASGEKHLALDADGDAEILIIEVPGQRQAR